MENTNQRQSNKSIKNNLDNKEYQLTQQWNDPPLYNDQTQPTQNFSNVQLNSEKKSNKKLFVLEEQEDVIEKKDTKQQDQQYDITQTVKSETKQQQINESQDSSSIEDAGGIVQEITNTNNVPQYNQQQKSIDEILKERDFIKKQEQLQELIQQAVEKEDGKQLDKFSVNLGLNSSKKFQELTMVIDGTKLLFKKDLKNQKTDLVHDFRFNKSEIREIIIKNIQQQQDKNSCISCSTGKNKKQVKQQQPIHYLKQGIEIYVQVFKKSLKIQFQNEQDYSKCLQKFQYLAKNWYQEKYQVEPQRAKKYYNNMMSEVMTLEELKQQSDTGDLLLITLSPTLCKLRRTFTGNIYDHVACLMNDIEGKWVFDIQDATDVQKVKFDFYMKYSSLVLNMSYRKINYTDQYMSKDDFHFQCANFLYKNYDAKFRISAGQLKRRNSGVQDNQEYFCSSFLAKMFKQLGALPEKKSCSRYWPDEFCEKKNLKFEKGVNFDPEIKVIMPKDLVTVIEQKQKQINTGKYRSQKK